MARVRYLLLSSRCPSVAAARLSYPGVSATALAAFEQPLSILSYSTLLDNKSIFWHFTRLILVTSSNPTLETLMSYLGQVNRRLNRWIWLGVRCFKKELMVNYIVCDSKWSSNANIDPSKQSSLPTYQISFLDTYFYSRKSQLKKRIICNSQSICSKNSSGIPTIFPQ